MTSVSSKEKTVDGKDDTFRTVTGPVIAFDYSQNGGILPPDSAWGPVFVTAGKKGGEARMRGGIGIESSTALTFMLSTALVYRLWGIKASSTYPPGVNQSMGVSLLASTQE